MKKWEKKPVAVSRITQQQRDYYAKMRNIRKDLEDWYTYEQVVERNYKDFTSEDIKMLIDDIVYYTAKMKYMRERIDKIKDLAWY